MKSIADFLAGKIRRAEVEERLTLELGGPAHPELGAHQGTLGSPVGTARFFDEGLIVGQSTVRYDQLVRVELAPERNGAQQVDLVTDAATLHIAASPAGALVLHATLRWIGHAILRRTLAD